MARTKGARGKKNVPTNKAFIDSLKQLSDKYLKRLDTIANDESTPATTIIRAAALIIGEAMLVMKHENYVDEKLNKQNTETPKPLVQEPNPFTPVFDFSVKLEESKNKKKSQSGN